MMIDILSFPGVLFCFIGIENFSGLSTQSLCLLFRYSKLFIKFPGNFAIFYLPCVVSSRGGKSHILQYVTLAAVAKCTCKHVRLARCSRSLRYSRIVYLPLLIKFRETVKGESLCQKRIILLHPISKYTWKIFP